MGSDGSASFEGARCGAARIGGPVRPPGLPRPARPGLRKSLHNPLVGDIELTGDSLELPGEDLTLIAHTADPGSHAQEQLDFLTSWSAGNKRSTEPVPANPSPATALRNEGKSRDGD